MNNQEIKALGDQYIMATYGRFPIALVKGEGLQVWDADDKSYLDFVSGIAVNALGHSHPTVAAAIAEQAHTIMHCSNLYYIAPQAELAQLLVENSALDKVFFCNSGAEANEAAIKLARKYAKRHAGPEKYEIISALESFHGRTLAAITATGQPKYQQYFDPLPAGFKYVPYNDLAALEKAIGPHTCAVLLEPVQGEGGVHPATPEYLQGVRELCRKHNLLLIFDEVQTGIGRTGKFFAYEHYGVEPDIMTLAKGIAGGFPMGAMLAKKEVAAAFQPGDHASTFGGNPLAATAALATLRTILEQGLVSYAARIGAYFKEKLQEMARRHPVIREVRGLGLLLGAELAVPGKELVDAMLARGFLINCTAGNVLRFIPPLVVKREEIDALLAALEEALTESTQH